MKPEQLKLFELPEREGKTHTFKTFRYPVWTENKARLIARYLYYFVQITRHGTYIDGFAAPQKPDMPDTWAARLVLENRPSWLRSFFLCDQKPGKAELLRSLKDEQILEGRFIETHCGDFNEWIYEVLQSKKVGPTIATFCLLDQRTFECHWKTVETLAKHKLSHKIEQFYFLCTGWLDRAFCGRKDLSIVERWWGRPDWSILRGLRGYERADVFCQRFRTDLGYSYADAWPIYSRDRRIMYHMIHATDHLEAPYLMARAYRKATGAKEPCKQFEMEFQQWRTSRRT